MRQVGLGSSTTAPGHTVTDVEPVYLCLSFFVCRLRSFLTLSHTYTPLTPSYPLSTCSFSRKQNIPRF